MPKLPFLILLIFTMFFTACGDYDSWPPEIYCPEAAGNHIELNGENLDSVYNELLILPSGKMVNGTPKFYPDRQACPKCDVETFEWCLPIDLNYDTTTYILKGAARIDTIKIYYTRKMVERHGCGMQVLINDLNLHSSFTYNFIYNDTAAYNRADSSMRIWRIWLDV